MARSHATQASAVMRRSVVIFALRHGAQASADPAREHAALDRFLAPFASLPFDDGYDRRCAEIRRTLERSGSIIGPHQENLKAHTRHKEESKGSLCVECHMPKVGQHTGQSPLTVRSSARTV